MENTNSYYRYSLDKSSKKYVCPQCQHKTFVLYVDNETGEPIADYVGMCDRADNCAYHYPPNQYFANNPNAGNAQQRPRPRPVIKCKPAPPPDYIDLGIVQDSIYNRPYEGNALFAYLSGVCGVQSVLRAFRKYGVGTDKDGATIFWQWDERLRVHTGKIIHYKPDGHRDHAKPPRWAHNNIKSGYNLQQCLFGAHLIYNETPKVAIVEAEKTAIVASIYLPDSIWLATGGLQNLQPEKFELLRGKDVILWPDLKATEKWQEKAEPLRRICRTVTISTDLEKIATDEQRAKGLDLADFLLCTPPP